MGVGNVGDFQKLFLQREERGVVCTATFTISYKGSEAASMDDKRRFMSSVRGDS